MATQFTGSIHDHRSLRELREAIQARGRVGLAVVAGRVRPAPHRSADTPGRRSPGGPAFLSARPARDVRRPIPRGHRLVAEVPGDRPPREIPSRDRADLMALLGIVALRRGEVDNCIACVGPSSCIFPIAREAVHTQPAGSREAVEWFTAYLDEWPGDLRVRWLLNIAYMTLGEYPDKVPPQYLIPLDAVPLEARRGPVRERGAAGRPDVAGPEPGRRQHLRRLHRRRPARPLHDLARRRPRGLALRQPRRRHVRGPLRRGRPRRPGLCPERSPAPTSTTTATSTSAAPRRLGEARCGCRCCGTRGTGSSRT